jgi:hypothetical protein
MARAPGLLGVASERIGGDADQSRRTSSPAVRADQRNRGHTVRRVTAS